MSFNLEELCSRDHKSTADFLDLLAALMVQGEVLNVSCPADEEFPNKLVIINRATLGKSPGYDIHLCADAEAATALADVLCDQIESEQH